MVVHSNPLKNLGAYHLCAPSRACVSAAYVSLCLTGRLLLGSSYAERCSLQKIVTEFLFFFVLSGFFNEKVHCSLVAFRQVQAKR